MNKNKLIELRCKAWGITEDEYYCNQCSDFSLEDMARAYRRGKNKGRADLEKENAELEEKISVLLSCKNCPENKGGYICQKEYEDKCLAQKIQYIKELKEENAELRNKLEHRNCLDCSNHSSNLRMRNLDLEKENAELNGKLLEQKQYTEFKCNEAVKKKEIYEREHFLLTKAKEIIREFMKYEINEYDGSLEIHFEELKKTSRAIFKRGEEMSGKQFIVIWGKKIVFVSNPFVDDKERETEYLKAREVYDKLSYKKQKCICETVYDSLDVMN